MSAKLIIKVKSHLLKQWLNYEEIQPGFADRILKMTEEESVSRKGFERKIINFSFLTIIIGQILGFLAV
ncbi:MAG: DUF2335 domain-containing protein [Bacteroidetes bacterium]|nr:DUF2335 domain-containing protein [Bacteroidota bacterium]